MTSSNSPELTLNCSFSSKNWVPKSTGEFILEVSKIPNASDKILKISEYVVRLLDEMKKIEAFKRELPLCMLLLNDAITTIQAELIQCKTSNTDPIMGPLKRKSPDEIYEMVGRNEEKDTNSRDKMNWMRSVQLWNSDNNKKENTEMINRRPTAELFPSVKNRKIEKILEPLKGCDTFPVMNIGKDELSRATELSLGTPEIKNLKERIYTNGLSSKSSCSRSGSSSATNGQCNVKEETNRKQRRCWSQELHRRFVNALQRLGGPQAATPKQIRELMQVDGLTNDEVKSHLQKFRLHMRRVFQSTNPLSALELGELWASQEHCGESSKPSISGSGSPQGPVHLSGSSRGTSINGADREEEDDKSESQSRHSRYSVITCV